MFDKIIQSTTMGKTRHEESDYKCESKISDRPFYLITLFEAYQKAKLLFAIDCFMISLMKSVADYIYFRVGYIFLLNLPISLDLNENISFKRSLPIRKREKSCLFSYMQKRKVQVQLDLNDIGEIIGVCCM